MSNTEFVARNGLVVGGNTRITMPVGNTVQRPSVPRTGDFRFNTDVSLFEGYISGSWSSLGLSSASPDVTYRSITLGNTTVFYFANSTLFTMTDPLGNTVSNTSGHYASNSTVSASLTPAGLLVGSVVLVNSSSIGLGNSTVSLIANSTMLRVGNTTVNNTVLSIGNSTVFSTMNATSYSGNVVVATSYTGTGIANTQNYFANVAGKVVTTDVLNLSGAYVPLTDAPTIAWDMATGINFSVTLAGSRTLANFINPQIGRSGILQVNMDATGGRTLSFGTNYFFDSDVAPVLGTGAGKMNFLNWHCFSATGVLITMAAKAV